MNVVEHGLPRVDKGEHGETWLTYGHGGKRDRTWLPREDGR